MQTIVDVVSGSLTYSGQANLGRATSDPFWTIKKISVSGNVTTTAYPCWPSRIPTDEDIFVWDRRAEYTYSLTPDTSAPTLSVVTIASNNSDTAKAKVWDVVTLTISASEALSTISATIAGHTATIVDTGTNTYTAAYTMVSGDTTGAVAFTIDFTDVSGRAGTQVTATTDLSAVTFDKTAPVGTLEYSIDAGSNYYTTLSVKNADTLRIRATFSENLLDSPVVKLAIDNAVLSATNMTKTSASVYYYDLNVPAWDIATATCSLSVGTDATGNVVTSAPVNATFTIDNTAIAMQSGERLSNTVLRVTLTENANDATITHANDGGFVVYETGTPATTYAVSAIAKSWSNSNKVELTVATVTASAAIGLTITYVAWVNWDVADTIGNPMATDAVWVLVWAWA